MNAGQLTQMQPIPHMFLLSRRQDPKESLTCFGIRSSSKSPRWPLCSLRSLWCVVDVPLCERDHLLALFVVGLDEVASRVVFPELDHFRRSLALGLFRKRAGEKNWAQRVASVGCVLDVEGTLYFVIGDISHDDSHGSVSLFNWL